MLRSVNSEMLKKNGKHLLVKVFSIFAVLIFVISVYPTNIKAETKKKIILIDPGHGGIDGGASLKDGTLEKDINLKISLKLKQELEKKYTVVLTRNEDKGLYTEKSKTVRKKKDEDLNNRCKMKKSSKCDAFLSIHLNMFPQTQYHGAQVWYANNDESKKLAAILQKNLREDLDKNNKRKEKVSIDDYRVLRNSGSIPSVIIECGFLSNPEEAARLKDDDYQIKLANSIEKSLDEFYK